MNEVWQNELQFWRRTFCYLHLNPQGDIWQKGTERLDRCQQDCTFPSWNNPIRPSRSTRSVLLYLFVWPLVTDEVPAVTVSATEVLRCCLVQHTCLCLRSYMQRSTATLWIVSFLFVLCCVVCFLFCFLPHVEAERLWAHRAGIKSLKVWILKKKNSPLLMAEPDVYRKWKVWGVFPQTETV